MRMSEAMRIVSLQVGKPKPVDFNGKTIQTAFWKEPSEEPLFLNTINFTGDEQADLVNHGGLDKAVCVYCEEHYAHWGVELGSVPPYGAFGENVTVKGLLEAEVCIGDVFQLGEAVVQISQPRQPCFKLARRHQRPDLPELVQRTGFSGYYFRVLQEGLVSPAAAVRLLKRHSAGLTVAFVNRIKYHDKRDLTGTQRVLSVPELSEVWRRSFEKRLAEWNGMGGGDQDVDAAGRSI